MKGITPFLWFDSQAEDAAKYYTSIFKNSKIETVTRYDEAGAKASGRPEGSAMTVSFILDGEPFTAINGGPHFRFTEAISFVIHCENQEEVDYYWGKLTEGGEEMDCSWLKDKYGLCWQVVPTELMALLGDKDPAKASRAMQAMLKMKKIDLPTLRKAVAG